MKVFIITLGTRGDVQPYVALGTGLQAAGHSVTLCTSSSFEPFVTAHGLNYGYMNNELIDLVKSPEGRSVVENATNAWQAIKTTIKMAKRVEPMQRRADNDGWRAAQAANPDLIIYHPKALCAPHYAEKLGVPAVLALYLPIYVPTSERPCIGLPQWNLGGWYNRLTYALVRKGTKLAVNKYVKRFRAQQGMPPQPRGIDWMQTTTGQPIEVLHGFSRHVYPTPSDWPESAAPTGFWFLDGVEQYQPPAKLEDFLAAGNPPVYVGFGSIAGTNPRRTGRIVVEALQQANVRGIIATGWGGLVVENPPETILTIDEAPHDWLFPRVAAVVHHGGCGTTAAGMRAGRPTVVCPFFADQPFWGSRVHALGVGSEPIPQKRLTSENLAAAIRKVTTDPAIRQSAHALGEMIRQENGVANAAAAIERMTRATTAQL